MRFNRELGLTPDRSLSQQLDYAKADVCSLCLKIEDVQTALTTASSFADDLQNQYEEVSAAKLKLEDELTKVQENLADRSTDSEAQQRNEQLFQLKDHLQNLQQKMGEERLQHEKEIEATAFGGQQDLVEARTRSAELTARVSELQSALASAQAGRKREDSGSVGLLHVKIQQLRAERDDLRRSKSFGEHEHHFALKAAEADRASALEELQIVRSELRQKTTAHDNLEVETTGLRDRLQHISARLESVAASFATASSEKNDLADRVAQLELELGHAMAARDDLESKVAQAIEQEVASHEAHRTHNKQLVDLASRLAMEQSDRSKAQNELFMSNRARSDLEARVDQLRSKIDELQAAQADANPSVASSGQVESQSPLPSTTLIQELQAEKADLQGRLQRRIRGLSLKFSVLLLTMRLETINQLQADLKRNNMNLHMAQESVQEHEDEIERLKAKRDGLEIDRERQINDKQVILDNLRFQHDEQSARVAFLDSALSDAQAEEMDCIRDLVLAMAVQQKGLSFQTSERRKVTKALQAATSTISQLRIDISSLEAATMEISTLAIRIEKSEAARRTAETGLDASNESLEKSLVDGRALRSALDITEASLTVAEQAAAEHALSVDRIAQLEAEIAVSEDRARILKADIGELLAKMALAEKARTDVAAATQTEMAEMRARTSALEAAATRDASRQCELDTLLIDFAASDREHAAVIAETEARIAKLGGVQQLNDDRTADLETQLAIKSAELESAVNRAGRSEAEILDQQSRIAAMAEKNADRLRTTEELREQLRQYEETSTRMAAERGQLETQIHDLDDKLSHSVAQETALRQKVADMADSAQELRTAIDKSENEERQSANMLKFKDSETTKL